MTETIIYMRNVPERSDDPNLRALTAPLAYLRYDGTWGEIEFDFIWDGSSVPWIFQGIFPRHRHPIASCRHDKRCREAREKAKQLLAEGIAYKIVKEQLDAERLFADEQFQIDVGKTSWWITKKWGWWGVRAGAFLGMGSELGEIPKPEPPEQTGNHR